MTRRRHVTYVVLTDAEPPPVYAHLRWLPCHRGGASTTHSTRRAAERLIRGLRAHGASGDLWRSVSRVYHTPRGRTVVIHTDRAWRW